MKYKIDVRSIWEFGQRRDDQGNPHQEDSLFPAHGEAQPSDRVFILCDGMGGHAAGEVASATVCKAMSNSLLPLKNIFSEQAIPVAVTAAYDALDAIDSTSEGKDKMGTTMTCLVLHEGGATIAHMGDSRVYHIRPGKEREDTEILFQTRDHSLVNDLIAIGEITPEEAKTHPRKNVITRALQPHVENRQKADVKTFTNVKAGDWFYMCSDGMLEQMDDSAIRFIFSDSTGDIDKKVEMLTLATRENRDNHTAFLVHVLEVECDQPIKKTTTALQPLMGDVDDSQPQTPRNTAIVNKTENNPIRMEASYRTDSKDVPAGISGKTMIVVLAALLLLIGGIWYLGIHKNDTKSTPVSPSIIDKQTNVSVDSIGKGDTVTYIRGKNKNRNSVKPNIIITVNGTTNKTVIRL